MLTIEFTEGATSQHVVKAKPRTSAADATDRETPRCSEGATTSKMGRQGKAAPVVAAAPLCTAELIALRNANTRRGGALLPLYVGRASYIVRELVRKGYAIEVMKGVPIITDAGRAVLPPPVWGLDTFSDAKVAA